MNRMMDVMVRVSAWLFLAAFPVLAREGPDRSTKQEGRSPLKVFILAGQSNMEGHGAVTRQDASGHEMKGTLVSMLKDKTKEPLVKHLVDAKGEWVVRDDVWVYFSGAKGPLQPGYGADKSLFGPELQFGHLVGNYYANQVLIIKTAWGGKSLKTDFRPPSSGGNVGPFYTQMIETVTRVLGDIKKEFPAYDGSGYELVGFGWWHGWNDACEPGGVAEYEQNLTNFIKDLRKDLKAPRLPILIAQFTGTSGSNNDPNWGGGLSKAQFATAQRPEFKGTAKFVPTWDFQRDEKDSPGGGAHHEWDNAETYFLVGDALGEGMLKLLIEQTTALTGPGPYVKLEALAKQIQAGQNVGGAFKTLADKKESKDPTEATEATTMLSALTTGAQEQLEDALRDKESDPAGAIPKLDSVATKFAGSEFGTRAKQESDTLKRDPKVQKELRSAEMLNQLMVFEGGMKLYRNARDPKSDGFKRLNAAAIQGLMSGCQTIIQRYPGTNGARKAEELMGRYR
jgi:alpha-galactosidase